MSLNKFTDGSIEHPWMNINCNSLTCNSITSATRYTLNEISLASVITTNGSGTLPITPAQLVNGTIGGTATTSLRTLSIQLPTATALNTYLGTVPTSTTNISFKFYAYASGTQSSNIAFYLNTGITTYNGDSGSPAFTVTLGTQKTLTFARTLPSTNWVIYF